ncbi:hypothetical protein [Streptomyces sp. R44]|uniref:Uncharacterized protein n=1 Tax=Streptomyces sp. R44 TaxID=3238633 RepID=A0AB39T513_9ACTN
MIVLIGPQSTDDERGDLEETAGFLGAVRMTPDVDWALVTGFLVTPDWERCSGARADVAAARVFGLPIEQLNTIR